MIPVNMAGNLAHDSTFGQGLVEESLTSADADCTRHFPLVKEDADFAVIRVLLPDVVPQLLEAALHAPVTDRKTNAILSVPWQVFHSSKRLDRLSRERRLAGGLPDKPAVLPSTQSTYASRL